MHMLAHQITQYTLMSELAKNGLSGNSSVSSVFAVKGQLQTSAINSVYYPTQIIDSVGFSQSIYSISSAVHKFINY